VCIAALLFVYTNAQSKPLTPPGDHFSLGQYYFNVANDPHGTYDLQKAREEYMAALAEDPAGNTLTWYQLGRIDFLEGHFVSAIYKFNKQIEYFGDSIPSVYYMLGLTLHMKRSNQAICHSGTMQKTALRSI